MIFWAFFKNFWQNCGKIVNKILFNFEWNLQKFKNELVEFSSRINVEKLKNF